MRKKMEMKKMKNTARILAIFALFGIVFGGMFPARLNAQTIQQTKDAAENVSAIVDEITNVKSFEDGNPEFFGYVSKLGKALKVGGAALGLLDVALELAKQDTLTGEQQILSSIEKANNKLDGIDQKLDRKFDELKVEMAKNTAYINLTSAGKDIDAEFLRWSSNKLKLRQSSNTMRPEYLDADTIFRSEGAVANVCKGPNNNSDSIYNSVARANNNSYSALPLLHVSISNKLYKAGVLGAYQRYRASYLTKLLEITKGTERPGQRENQIADIERNPNIPSGQTIPFEFLRNQYLREAKKQVATEMEPFWSACDKSFTDAVTKYSDPNSVNQAAKSVVENEFLTKSGIEFKGINIEKLPLLLTDSGSQTYKEGNGLSIELFGDGTYNPTVGGGKFAAAIGKRLEELFPGYGFVVIAYTNFVEPYPSNLTNRCDGATPIKWNTDNAFGNAAKKPLIWSDLIVDGPLRKCSGIADKYSFNLIVSGFHRATTNTANTKEWLKAQNTNSKGMFSLYNGSLTRDSQEYGKAQLATVNTTMNPSLVSVFAALPDFAGRKRANPYYYLYQSKYPDMVSYLGNNSGMFYVVMPKSL